MKSVEVKMSLEERTHFVCFRVDNKSWVVHRETSHPQNMNVHDWKSMTKVKGRALWDSLQKAGYGAPLAVERG